MPKPKHTRGPWKLVTLEDDPSFRGFRNLGEMDRAVMVCSPVATRIYGAGKHSEWVADVGPYADPEHLANARLIAAAPDMLAVLMMLDAYVASEYREGAGVDIMAKVRAAISLAIKGT